MIDRLSHGIAFVRTTAMADDDHILKRMPLALLLAMPENVCPARCVTPHYIEVNTEKKRASLFGFQYSTRSTANSWVVRDTVHARRGTLCSLVCIILRLTFCMNSY